MDREIKLDHVGLLHSGFGPVPGGCFVSVSLVPIMFKSHLRLQATASTTTFGVAILHHVLLPAQTPVLGILIFPITPSSRRVLASHPSHAIKTSMFKH